MQSDPQQPAGAGRAPDSKPSNGRTLAVLASVALMFFVGVIVKRALFG
jgi:hypothetical protein